MSMTEGNSGPSTVRRVVTGVDAAGRSVVNSDGPAPIVVQRPNGTRLYGLWATDVTPPALDGPDLCGQPYVDVLTMSGPTVTTNLGPS
jgi:hypothetical protein